MWLVIVVIMIETMVDGAVVNTGVTTYYCWFENTFPPKTVYKGVFIPHMEGSYTEGRPYKYDLQISLCLTLYSS
jgi:hypothetical protein